jgi:hypothetical protein
MIATSTDTRQLQFLTEDFWGCQIGCKAARNDGRLKTIYSVTIQSTNCTGKKIGTWCIPSVRLAVKMARLRERVGFQGSRIGALIGRTMLILVQGRSEQNSGYPCKRTTLIQQSCGAGWGWEKGTIKGSLSLGQALAAQLADPLWNRADRPNFSTSFQSHRATCTKTC